MNPEVVDLTTVANLGDGSRKSLDHLTSADMVTLGADLKTVAIVAEHGTFGAAVRAGAFVGMVAA